MGCSTINSRETNRQVSDYGVGLAAVLILAYYVQPVGGVIGGATDCGTYARLVPHEVTVFIVRERTTAENVSVLRIAYSCRATD